MVEVEQHEPDAARRRARVRDASACGQLLEQHHAVRQLGERIVAGAVREQRLDALVLRHVVHDAEQAALVARRPRGICTISTVSDAAAVRRATRRTRPIWPSRLAREKAVMCGDEHVGRQHARAGRRRGRSRGRGRTARGSAAFVCTNRQTSSSSIRDDERGLRERVEHGADVGRDPDTPSGPAPRLRRAARSRAAPPLRPLGCVRSMRVPSPELSLSMCRQRRGRPEWRARESGRRPDASDRTGNVAA